jgi:hypothetical protein
VSDLEPRDFVFGGWDWAKYNPGALADAADLLRKKAKENPAETERGAGEVAENQPVTWTRAEAASGPLPNEPADSVPRSVSAWADECDCGECE